MKVIDTYDIILWQTGGFSEPNDYKMFCGLMVPHVMSYSRLLLQKY